MLFIMNTFFTIIIPLFFFFASHPLIMTLILVLLAIYLAFKLILLNKMLWASYLIILMIISAMMIMFIYMASLVPNEPHLFYKTKFMKFLIPLIVMLMWIMVDNNKIHYNFKLQTIMLIPQSFLFMIFLIMYLLILLFILILIIPLNSGPLRS